MSTVTSGYTTFPHFSLLPTELRFQIWRDALPIETTPGLFPYRKGCWSPRYLSPSDKKYKARCKVHLDFRHDLLDPIQVQLPLFFVNQEARYIALAWCRKEGIQILPPKDGERCMFIRAFDPQRDALHVALHQLNSFYSDPIERIFEPDLAEHNIGTCASLTQIAVPESLVPRKVDVLCKMLRWFPSLKVLFLIVGLQPERENDKDKDKDQGQEGWELEGEGGKVVFWDHQRREFSLGSGEWIGDGSIYKQILEEAEEKMRQVFLENYFYRSIEIRPVLAVRR